MTQDTVSDEWVEFLFVLMLPKLTLTERKALYLRVYKKMSHSQINATLGITSSKVLLSRAQNSVRQAM